MKSQFQPDLEQNLKFSHLQDLNIQGGASTWLSTLSLEELKKHQTERVQLLLQQQEEKEQKMKLENQKKEEELKRENREKEEALKAENERLLSLLIQENKSQEALMLAKHEGEERAARKADQLETERNASASNQPQVPECPVGILNNS